MSIVPYLRSTLGISGVSPAPTPVGSIDVTRWEDAAHTPIEYLLAAQPSLALSESQIADFTRFNRHFVQAGTELEGPERHRIQQVILNQIFRRLTLEQRAEARLVLGTMMGEPHPS